MHIHAPAHAIIQVAGRKEATGQDHLNLYSDFQQLEVRAGHEGC